MSETDTGAVVAEGNTAPTQVQVVEAPPAKTMEDTMAEVFDKMNPPRDNGRFAAREKTETPAVETKEPAPATETTDQAQTTEAEPAKVIDSPQSWSAEMKAKWADLSPDVQNYVLQRESEAQKRLSELGTAAKAVEPYRQVAEKFGGSFRGIDPVQAFTNLAAANEFIEGNPVEGLKWLAQHYGVDLSTLASGQQTQSTETNPEVAQLRQTISQLQRQVADTSNRVVSREQQERAEFNQSIEKTVTDFAADKERAPYWDELEPGIFQQIHALQATEPNLSPKDMLERAYDRALKLNEGVQAKIAAEKKAEADKKAKADAAQKAAAAKKAASVNVRSGQGTSPQAKGSMEDTLREVADRLMG